MLSRWIRKWDSLVLRPLLTVISALGITPDMITVASLMVVISSGGLVASGQMVLGGVVLLLGGLLDGMDGELARMSGAETKFGAFLDSISDHCGDFAVYFGLLWYLVHRGGIIEILLLFAAMFGSLFGSQVRSRAAMVGIDTKDVGICTRLERIVILVSGLCFARILWALWGLAVLTNISALQRVIHVLVAARPSDHTADRVSH